MHAGSALSPSFLNLLSADGLQVHVICCAHAEQVKQHLETAGWLQERASLTVKVRGCPHEQQEFCLLHLSSALHVILTLKKGVDN